MNNSVCWGSSRVNRNRRTGGRGIRGRVGSSGGGRGPGRGGGLGGSAPRVLTIFCKMARLVTAPAFISIRTVSSFMGAFADGTLKGLTRIPHTTRIALDVALKRYVVVQRHTHNAGTGGYVLKTSETLQSYLVHSPSPSRLPRRASSAHTRLSRGSQMQ